MRKSSVIRMEREVTYFIESHPLKIHGYSPYYEIKTIGKAKIIIVETRVYNNLHTKWRYPDIHTEEDAPIRIYVQTVTMKGSVAGGKIELDPYEQAAFNDLKEFDPSATILCFPKFSPK